MAREYLIALRKQRYETQQAVAMSIGVTRQNYSQIEKGIRQQRMDIVTAKRLADHFGVPLDYIVEHETQETPLAVNPPGVSLPVLPVQMAEGG